MIILNSKNICHQSHYLWLNMSKTASLMFYLCKLVGFHRFYSSFCTLMMLLLVVSYVQHAAASFNSKIKVVYRVSPQNNKLSDMQYL